MENRANSICDHQNYNVHHDFNKESEFSEKEGLASSVCDCDDDNISEVTPTKQLYPEKGLRVSKYRILDTLIKNLFHGAGQKSSTSNSDVDFSGKLLYRSNLKNFGKKRNLHDDCNGDIISTNSSSAEIEGSVPLQNSRIKVIETQTCFLHTALRLS